MALFTRNTMDPTDMSRLAGYCALMILLSKHYEDYWPVSRDHRRYIRHWLRKSRHRAPLATLTALAAIADTVAQRFLDERPEEVASLIESKDETLSEHLMGACREEIDSQGLSS